MKINTRYEEKDNFLNKNKERFRQMFDSLKKLGELEKKIIETKLKENAGKPANS